MNETRLGLIETICKVRKQIKFALSETTIFSSVSVMHSVYCDIFLNKFAYRIHTNFDNTQFSL